MRQSVLAVWVALLLAVAAAGAAAAMPAERRSGDGGARPMPVGVGADAAGASSPWTTFKDQTEPGYFIVVLEQEPLAMYQGGLSGLPATSPSVTGAERLDVDSPSSRAYVTYLASVQASFVNALQRELGREMEVAFRYRYALNGLAVWLSPEEAAEVARMPGVRSVSPNIPQLLDTDAGPRWIGSPGIWTGSAWGGEGTMGEGIVVGIVDTGINIDHPSFAEVDKNGYEHRNPKEHYLGLCDPANPQYDEKWRCNEKLIGLYNFLDGTPNQGDPEDDNGHGSHTAGTTAGNFVTAPYGGPTLTLDLEVSGVAPHANIVAYDACFTTQGGQGTCPPTATLAALDQAVADEVDVVNYSISSSNLSPWDDPHSLAFRAIREAGIFAAVSAGNSGPGAGTTAAIAPWVTAVGATTHDRYFGNQLTDTAGGDSAPPGTMESRSLSAGVGPAPIVYAGSGDYVNVSGQPDNGACAQPFPAGTFSGEIVVCDRLGGTARVVRGANVLAGGAGGFVLANTQQQGGETVSDPHVLPAAHISYADGVALKDWLQSGSGHTATITPSAAVYEPSEADQVAGFSSRGPAIAGLCCRRPDLDLPVTEYFSVVKPDVAAPGVDVIAPVASGGDQAPPEFEAYGGTSMSSPHVAGAAALLLSARPEWTIAEVQSALMTTAITEAVVKEDGTTAADPFDYGAGRVDVSQAVQAGIVLNVTSEELDAADPRYGGDPRDINLASMADAECLDRCGWTRTVRSTLDEAVEWTASVELPEEWSDLPVTVTPETFTLAPGGTQEISVELDLATAVRGNWVFASLMLRPAGDAAPEAHLPIAVLPVQSLLPSIAPIYTLESSGQYTIGDVRAVEITDLQLTVSGLAQGTVSELELAQDPTPDDRFTPNEGKALITMTLPAGPKRVLAEVASSESEDIDMLMGYDANGDGLPQPNEVVCVSFGESWAEICEFVGGTIPAGTMWVLVQNYAASENAPDATTVVTAVVPALDAGNLTATGPSAVPFGEPFDIELAWDLPGLQPGDRWYGVVEVGSDPATPDDLGTILVDLIGAEPPPPTVTPTPRPTSTPEPVDEVLIFLPKASRNAE